MTKTTPTTDQPVFDATNYLNALWPHPSAQSLGQHFSRLGWIGFLMQLVLVAVPIFLLLYVLFVSSPESAQRKGIDLSNYLS